MTKRKEGRPKTDAESNGTDFTAGETEMARTATPEAETPTDPEGVAKLYLFHRAAGVKEEVTGNVILHLGIVDFRDDPESLQKLLDALVGAKVLSRHEALAGLDGRKATISMLRKIALHADVILHPKILPLLQPGYSVLYQVACLYEDLEANDGQD